ncbi:Rap guanine nucleotide exchange factor 6 PDZ domain-containing guanine nucleotide exchange factor 2 [Collichthys lucidus]|uniref:Rap guanine nucleotide exchange factor 6 PDZ domain-containing guanine nucleotide exchange factor 2 n=1 Tax=Collichthys lucidus TaxID=240159 RepID=A0A4U5V8S8_COLLU|nr:Rap guanine nucleotide exchange factor 6 PDZ domain-containing guanine nucleotide exchange factor 2 [Collichthys lucidus]
MQRHPNKNVHVNCRSMCTSARYERHEANHILFFPDTIATCWYILLSGSVFVKEHMYLARCWKTFGLFKTNTLGSKPGLLEYYTPPLLIVDNMLDIISLTKNPKKRTLKVPVSELAHKTSSLTTVEIRKVLFRVARLKRGVKNRPSQETKRRESFGKQLGGRRGCECITLEPSEMIVNWMFNQEPAEEQDQISEAPGHEAESRKKEGNTLKDHNSDFQNLTENLDHTTEKSNSENQNLEFTNLNSVPKTQKSEFFKRSSSEPCSQVSNSEDQSSSCDTTPEGCGRKSRRSCYSEEGVDCVLQVDNGSEGDDSFLQREGSQRRSRRRFRRVNPRGERELITDGQEPTGHNTVGETPQLSAEDNTKRSFSSVKSSCWRHSGCFIIISSRVH